MDYSNLGNRAKGAKERVEADRAPLEEGEFKCILRSGTFGKSRANNDMFTLNMKIVDKDASERMLDEILKIRFVITPNTEHQLDQCLAILNSWGADLSKVKKEDDWEDVFIDLAAARAKAVVNVRKDEKNDKYYNFDWLEVIRALNLDGMEDEPAEEPEPKPKKRKPKAKPKAEPVEPVEEPEPTPEPEPAADDGEDVDW